MDAQIEETMANVIKSSGFGLIWHQAWHVALGLLVALLAMFGF